VRISFLFALCLALFSLPACNSSQAPDTGAQNLTDRDRDGLAGPVKAVLTADVILAEQNGQWLEIQQASSTSIYDQSGKRTLQTPFRIAAPGGYAITPHDAMFNPRAKRQRVEEPAPNDGGKWFKNYDDKGLLIEAARHDASGKRVESFSVTYEFDSAGNWIKRRTRRSTESEQTASSQPDEASYRHIVYFNSPAPNRDQAEIIPASAKQLKSPIAANEANLARGQTLFNQKCAACHGENGRAQTEFAAAMPTRPEDFTGEKVVALTDGEVYSVISDGVKPSGMPAFKGRISDDALWQIALYARRLSRHQPASGQDALASSSPTPQPKAPPAAVQRYPFKGKVVSVERELRQVMVEHEEIKGYMGAMTMPFPLKDEKTLAKIKKDDRIEATLVVDGNGWRLENVVIK
jgi:mono/diheme cytochrome c family protein/Cu/Ag efflux protein CusF